MNDGIKSVWGAISTFLLMGISLTVPQLQTISLVIGILVGVVTLGFTGRKWWKMEMADYRKKQAAKKAIRDFNKRK